MRKPDDQEKDKLAKGICAEIRESEREKERLRDRWLRLKAIHNCEESTSQVQLIEGQKPYMLPLSRAKSDRIVSAVVDGITGIEPYVQCFDEGEGNNQLDDLEKDLGVLAQDAGDESAIREGTADSLQTNAGVWRIRPLVGERPYDTQNDEDATKPVTRIDWESIDPLDVCCYPPYFGTFASAKTIGHRWSELLYRVKADQEAGKYYECDLHGGDDPMRLLRTADTKLEPYEPQTISDDFIELWEVITESDWEKKGVYKKYLCVVAISQEKLLSIQDYPYSRSWYVEVRTEKERNRVWSDSSVMQRLQGLQLAYSDAFTALIQAAFATIGPITVLSGGGLMSKVTQAKPFMIIEAPADVKVQYIQAAPQVGELPGSLEKIEQVSDALTGISRTGQSQESNHSVTATEISGLLQAQAEAKDAYTQVVAVSVEAVFKLIFEYYKVHYNDLKRVYGDRLLVDEETIQTVNPNFRVNGSNGANNPALMMQKLQVLLNLVATVPGNNFDLNKILDQFAQALDLPFSIKRLQKDEDPMAELVKQPQVLQLLESGMTLPQIVAILQAHAQNLQSGGEGSIPGAPVGEGPGGGPNPSPGTAPSGLDTGAGMGGPQGSGGIPGA